MTDTAAPPPTKDAFKQEIEKTRALFHELLQSLSPEEFKKKSGNPAWSNGQLMWHMSWGVGYIPQFVERCRTGKDLKLPRGVLNLINPWITRWGSRGITPEKVANQYDAATTEALKVLETVQDDEWSKGARITGDYQTVTHHFEMPAVHFAEHKADILKGLGRTV